MEFFRSLPCWLWPLIAGIICGILGYLLGRLFSSSNKTVDLSEELEECNTKRTSLQEELDACKNKSSTLQIDLDASKRNASILEANLNTCNANLKIAEEVPKVIPTPASKPATPTPPPVSKASAVSSFAAGAATASTTRKTPDAPKVTSVTFDADGAKAAFGKKIKEDDLTVVEGIGPKISELFKTNGVTTWAALASTSIERCQEILNTGGKRYEIHNPGSWPKQSKMASLGQWTTLKKWQSLHPYGRE